LSIRDRSPRIVKKRESGYAGPHGGTRPGSDNHLIIMLMPPFLLIFGSQLKSLLALPISATNTF